MPFLWIKQKANLKKVIIAVFLVSLLYGIIRLPIFLISADSVEKRPLQSWEKATATTFIYRGLTYPFKMISQSFLPYSVLSSASNQIVHFGYPHIFVSDNQANPYIRESIVYDLVSYLLSVFIIFIGFMIYRFSHIEAQYKKVLLFSFAFVCISALPYMLLPGRSGFFSIFEPRSLYMPTVGIAFLLTIFLYTIFRKIKYWQYIVLIICVIFTFYHTRIIWNTITALKQDANIRKSVINQTYELFPDVPEKVIFYSESDKSYYGFPENEKILPFQSGYGQTLLMWYAFHSEEFPACFFENNYLYPLEEKGLYKECDGRGFGYFRDYDRLLEVVRSNNFPPEKIYAISWNSTDGVITDITKQVQNRVKKDLVQKSKAIN